LSRQRNPIQQQEIPEEYQGLARTEESREIHLARYQAISAGIMVYNADNRISYVNQAAGQILGLSCEELIGRSACDPIWQATYEDGSPLPPEEYPSAKVLSTGESLKNVIIGIFAGKLGPRRWLMVNAEPIIDRATGAYKETIITFVDVTDRKIDEQKLVEAETKYRDLVEKALVGVYIIQNGKFVYVNPRFAETHQFSQDELIGMDVLDIVFPADREVVKLNIEQRIAGKVKSMHYTMRAIRRDGKYIDIEVFGSSTTYKGKPAVIGTELDITQRKRDEEILRLNEARLQALLKLSRMTDATLQEITDFALQEAINLTKSKVGYLAFTNEDETVLNMFAWSESARGACNVPDKPTVYPVESTGLWGEAIRQRKPIITNDYSAPNPYKRGLPKGHIQLKNHMNVPVFEGEHIVAVAGVGNKDEDYDDSDVRQLTLVMDGMWKHLQHRRIAMERRKLEKSMEAQKRQFYRETILSVTDGKLNICDPPDLRPYLSRAIIKTEVKDPSQVGPARRMLERYFAENGLAGDRLSAFTIAVGEAITNAVKHGGFGRVYGGTKDGSVWASVTDNGGGIESLILPRATLMRGFSTKPSMGLGYSIILEIADRVLLKTGRRGTTVILLKNLVEQEPIISPEKLPDTWSSIPSFI
jgi:PAS domain S-box-containing protein